MQSRSIGIMTGLGARRTKHEAEMAIEVMDVRLIADQKWPFAKAKCIHHRVVEGFRAFNVGNCEVDVINADDFWHVLNHHTASATLHTSWPPMSSKFFLNKDQIEELAEFRPNPRHTTSFNKTQIGMKLK